MSVSHDPPGGDQIAVTGVASPGQAVEALSALIGPIRPGQVLVVPSPRRSSADRSPRAVLGFTHRGVALWTGPAQPPRMISSDDAEIVENVRGHRYGRLTVLGGGRALSVDYGGAGGPELEGLLAGFRRAIAVGGHRVREDGGDAADLPAAWFLTLSHERAHLYEGEPVAWTFSECGGPFRRKEAALAMVTSRELVIICGTRHRRHATARDRRTIYVPRRRLLSVDGAGPPVTVRTDGGAHLEVSVPPRLMSWLNDRL